MSVFVIIVCAWVALYALGLVLHFRGVRRDARAVGRAITECDARYARYGEDGSCP